MVALSYADDITLSCQSVHDLNKMMNICSDIATDHFITFNAKKTIYIKYGESVRLTEHVILDGNVISWHTGVHIRHQFILRDIKFLHSLLQSTNSIVRQCIINASSKANTLIGYKMSYYRSMYGIDTCNADLNYCLLHAKPLLLKSDQHAHVKFFI